MPELPDVELYAACLREKIVGRKLVKTRIANPFLVRSVEPEIDTLIGTRVSGVRRIGKRIVLVFEGQSFLVIHLMKAGRFQWKEPNARLPGKIGLAAFGFENGSLILTEAGTKRRASLYVVQGEAGLAAHNPGGLEVLDATAAEFASALRRQNRTLKRALTDPRLISGIGNAYSDEILHAACLSPLAHTGKLTDADLHRLFAAARATLERWTDELVERYRGGFPKPGDVTAFREGFAVHGRFGEPCPACGTKVQRIRYAENELNYCPECQTGGRIMADRSLSRLLKDDWPRAAGEMQ